MNPRAVSALETADARTRVHDALQEGVAALVEGDPGMQVPDLQVSLIVGDPTNRHFMDEVQGFSAFSGISGYIAITVRPTARVPERLEAIVVHELHHNVRYSPGRIVWKLATITIGEHPVTERLADHFRGRAVQSARIHPLHERADAHRRCRPRQGRHRSQRHGHDRHFASWGLGDASARLSGGQPVGLPTGAGYATGARIVQGYLDMTGPPPPRASVPPPPTSSQSLFLSSVWPAQGDTERHRRTGNGWTNVERTVHELAERAGISGRTLRHYRVPKKLTPSRPSCGGKNAPAPHHGPGSELRKSGAPATQKRKKKGQISSLDMISESAD